MSSTKITTRRLACTAGLVLAALALAGGVAAGAGGGNGQGVCTTRAQDCMTDAEFRALSIRSVALNRKYGLGE